MYYVEGSRKINTYVSQSLFDIDYYIMLTDWVKEHPSGTLYSKYGVDVRKVGEKGSIAVIIYYYEDAPFYHTPGRQFNLRFPAVGYTHNSEYDALRVINSIYRDHVRELKRVAEFPCG